MIFHGNVYGDFHHHVRLFRSVSSKKVWDVYEYVELMKAIINPLKCSDVVCEF